MRPIIQRIIGFFMLAVLCVYVSPLAWAEDAPSASTSRRPCTGLVTLYLDNDEIWRRDSEEMREMEGVVEISDGNQRGKKGILLATLIESVPNIQAVEVSTCRGKVRRFEGEKLQARKNSLYLVITNYRGLKLFNSTGESGRGSRLKNIDQVKLITQPE